MSKGVRVVIIIAIVVGLLLVFGVRVGTCKYCGNSGILLCKTTEFGGYSRHLTACTECWDIVENTLY